MAEKPAELEREFLWNLVYGDPDKAYKKIKAEGARAGDYLGQISDNSSKNAYIMIPCKSGIVDIVNDYAWTKSPKEARDAVPFIQLREMHQVRGADLQKLLFYTSGMVDNVKSAATALASTAADIGVATKNMVTSAANKIENVFSNKTKTTNTNENPANNTSKIIQEIKAKASEKISYGNILEHQHLKPYDNLYACNYTGWQFKIPIFNNELMETPANKFTDEKTSLIGGLLKLTGEVAEGIAGGLNTIRQLTGNVQTNIEPPKSYSYSSQSQTISIKFPLLNTLDIQTAYKNYDLIQLLKYQSRPYKCDMTSIIPIHIYELSIPGVKYLPYAYIQNVDIQFLGVRRVLPIKIKVDNKLKESTFICPEAYEVTITLEGLTNESQNFMVEAMFNNQNMFTGMKDILQ